MGTGATDQDGENQLGFGLILLVGVLGDWVLVDVI